MDDRYDDRQTIHKKRREPHRVIISRGDTVRSFTISPWIAGIATGLSLLFGVGYLGATAYLVLRDNIIDASAQRTAQLQFAYEDRITDLRTQIDRLTSRNVLDYNSYEEKMEHLATKQLELGRRHEKVETILQMAANTGLTIALNAPFPSRKPPAPTDVKTAATAASENEGSGIGGTAEPIKLFESNLLGLRGSKNSTEKSPFALVMKPTSTEVASSGAQEAKLGKVDAKEQFLQYEQELDRIDMETQTALDSIAVTAEQKINKVLDATRELGLKLPPIQQDAGSPGERKRTTPSGATGGPFVALNGGAFDLRLARAEKALNMLTALKAAAERLPLGSPVSGAPLSSSFGPRVDPFLGRMAMHTGIDYRVKYGSPVHAVAPGRVTVAERTGGYGLMVEIEHENGVTTRHAHLSRILVNEGDVIADNQIIGRVGSTGRSTGPHLHYETRINDEAVNPMRFIRAADRIDAVFAD